jgi:hypothetical protein
MRYPLFCQACLGHERRVAQAEDYCHLMHHRLQCALGSYRDTKTSRWDTRACFLGAMAVGMKMAVHLRLSVSPLRSKADRKKQRKRAHDTWEVYIGVMREFLRRLGIERWEKYREVCLAALKEFEKLEDEEERQEKARQAKDGQAEDGQAENGPSNGHPTEDNTSPEDAFMRTVGAVWREIVASVGPLLPSDPTSSGAGGENGGENGAENEGGKGGNSES